MTLMNQILSGCEFKIDALRLENDANLAPQIVGILRRVVAENGRMAGYWDHQRRKNSEQGGFAAAVRPQKPEQLCSTDIE
jgi:hypothetical protein